VVSAIKKGYIMEMSLKKRDRLRDQMRSSQKIFVEGGADIVGLMDGNFVISMILRLQEILETIPEEYRDAAYFELMQGWDNDSTYDVCYKVLETNEEVDKRIDRAEKAKTKNEQDKLNTERKDYERLKKKFDG
jgi:hypothetical protein